MIDPLHNSIRVQPQENTGGFLLCSFQIVESSDRHEDVIVVSEAASPSSRKDTKLLERGKYMLNDDACAGMLLVCPLLCYRELV